MEVRDIITEALSRANLVVRRQPDGAWLMNAYKLLVGVVSKFNNDNFLSFTQMSLDLPARSVIHIYDEQNTMLGENNVVFSTSNELSEYPLTEQDYENGLWGFVNDGAHVQTIYSVVQVSSGEDISYEWHQSQMTDGFDPRYQQIMEYVKAYHIKVDGVSKLNTLNINRNQPYGMLKLSYIPHADFDSYSNSDLLWTFKELAQGEWVIKTKPYIASQAVKLRLDYNKAVEFDLDTDLRIPDAYVELLTVALTYKLALAYPRMDDTHVERLRNELTEMINNVSTPKADAKQVLRDDCYDDRSSYWGVIGGRMWG